MQILVAEGEHPARQRNAALGRAQGEILVFLDNDCSIGSGYWRELETALARPEVEIVGGPALLRPNAAAWEEIFHALLTHTLIVGTVSCALYAAGRFSPGDPDRPYPVQSRGTPIDFRQNRPAFDRPLSQRGKRVARPFAGGGGGGLL